MCECVHVLMCMCRYTRMCVCSHMEPEAGVRCLPQFIPTLFFETGSLPGPSAHWLDRTNWLTRGWTWSRYTEWNSQRTNKMRGKPFRSSGCVTRWALWWLNHLPSPSSRDPSWSKHQGHQVQICRYLFPHAGAEAPSLQQAGYGVSLSLNLISLSF